MTVPLEICIDVPAGSVGRKRKMMLLHEAMKEVLGYLQQFGLKEFLVKTRKPFEWKCLRLEVSYSCDVSDGDDTSGLGHTVAVNRSCV